MRTAIRLVRRVRGQGAAAKRAEDLPTRSSSIDGGRRRPGQGEPTNRSDVEPKPWAPAWHGLAESATSIARHPPGLGPDDA